MPEVRSLDGLEVHDCFSITEYMIIDHMGLTAPGESYRAIDDSLLKSQRIQTSGTFIQQAQGKICEA